LPKVLKTHSDEEDMESLKLNPKRKESKKRSPQRKLKTINHITRQNINININIKNYCPPKESNIVFIKGTSKQTSRFTKKPKPKQSNDSLASLADSLRPDMRSHTIAKSPSKWKKISNLITAVQSFHRYDTKYIGNDSDIDIDLNDYKTRLLSNTIKNRSILDSKYMEGNIDDNKELNDILREEQEEELRNNILNEILE
jgi:hypothetical protein